MGAPRNPEVSKKVEQARELIAADPDRSLASVARKVGLTRPTLAYRLEHDPPAAHSPDALPENPDDPSEIPVFIRDYRDRQEHRIYPIGDLHIGAPEHAGSALDEWLQFLVESDRVSMLNTGDNTNCAIPGSVSDQHTEKLTVGEARELQTKKFQPLAEKDKIDAIIDGNHENRVWRAVGDSPNAAVAAALRLNYSRAACIVRYLVGSQVYNVYLRHGKGGGSMMGSAVNALQRQESIIDADIYISGHTHTQVAFPKNVFVPNESGGYTRKKRLFVCSGSFVGYEDYAAEAGFPPAHIGAPRVYLDGRRKDAHASV